MMSLLHSGFKFRYKICKVTPVAFIPKHVAIQGQRRFFRSSISLASSADLNDGLETVPDLPRLSWDRGSKTSKEGLTPLYASMRKVIDKNPDAICLIQVGSFYELYFEQAEDYAPLLGLKVASRKTNNLVIPMAGFPVYQLQKFLKILIQDIGINVAIIDQYPHTNEFTPNLIHRRISRIVTPGTLIDESFLHFNTNNYLVSISLPGGCSDRIADPDMEVGIAWVDLSVGDFYVQKTTLENLSSDITRITPNEIILPHEILDANISSGSWFPSLQVLQRYFLRYHKPEYNDLKDLFKENLMVVRKHFEDYSTREEAAINMILSYIKINLPDINHSLEIPSKYWNSDCVQMDSRTQEALELAERFTNGKSSVVGSLFTTIKRTVTPSGTRLLTQWIKSPILDSVEIQKRQKFVSLFLENKFLRTTLKEHMSRLGDFIRSVQRLSLGTGDSSSHILNIGDAIEKLSGIEQLLRQDMLSATSDEDIVSLVERFEVPVFLSEKISETMNTQVFHTEYESLDNEQEELDSESKSSGSNSKGMKSDDLSQATWSQFCIVPSHIPQLHALHLEFKDLLKNESQILDSIKNDINSIDPKLSLVKKITHGRFQNVLQISGKQKSIQEVSVKYENNLYDRRKGSVIFKSQEWDILQLRMQQKIQEIKQIERQIIEKLRLEILDLLPEIREINKLVDYLDITSSFATLAEENNLVCPKFVKSSSLNITNGRHIVVESGLASQGDMFIPNDTKLGAEGSMWVITGPNTGGKSTYLRQNALIVIMAQIGSFVPADKASLSVVDKIFTRIGASDDLFSDLSTFMVEMTETSNILKNATSRSLAIVDEIGRGTSGKEGLAIAYATLVNLLQVNKCRTLFATHYGNNLKELLSLDDVNQNKIRYYKTRAISFKNGDKENLTMDYRLSPGISEKSYAIEIATRAGFPESAIKRAEKALNLLDKTSN